MIRIISFGFKFGEPVPNNRVIDCRSMRNPHHDAELCALTGLDAKVQEFVAKDRRYFQLLDLAQTGIKGTDIIAIGCFGGRHRSVAVAEAVGKELAKTFDVEIYHRELDIRVRL